jgi:(E)-4-hydroxy-3-methylbut-2-enyl-diphosphate synthase
MLNCLSDDIAGNVKQAVRLEQAGCEIIRAAVPKEENAVLVAELKKAVKIPVVADIHFDYRAALAAIRAGADKIRINPGNIGSPKNVEKVISACKEKDIAVRIGVNSGSLEKELLLKYGSPSPSALVESAMKQVELLESFGFYNIVISVKTSDVRNTVSAYRLLHQRTNYPLHLGVTEAGTVKTGLVKSAVGIGSLLCDGIGDTIRVSLTAPPDEEIKAAKLIFKAIGYGDFVNIISCPTCGRTKIDIISLAENAETELDKYPELKKRKLTIAVMGCAVNGPGEAKEADYGIAGGNGEGLLFRKGEILRKVRECELVGALVDEVLKG